MAFRLPFALLKKIFRNLYFLTFLNGFLLASLFYFKMEGSYENQLFAAINQTVRQKIDADDTQDSIVIKTMQLCNELLYNRAPIFTASSGLHDFNRDYLHPTTVDLMTTQGACGSYSLVLARLLQLSHYPVRIAQMKVRGIYAAHNVVEVYTNNGWVVLDPTFDTYFKKPGSGLASFADVSGNWKYYSAQTPPGYDTGYRYEGVRYANWEKVPVLFPAIKGVLNLALGKERANKVCVRTYLLKMYNVYFYLTLLVYIPVFLLTFRRFIKTKLFPHSDIPFTFANLVKYSKLHLPPIQ